LKRAGQRDAALQIFRTDEGKRLMDNVRNAVAVMRQEEEKLLQQRAEESKASFQITKLSILLPALIGSVLVGSVFYLSQRNLTQRQRAAEVLAEQRERLRVTLASIGDAVITTDVEGCIAYMNAVAESLSGWTQDEAVGKPLDAVFRILNEQTRKGVENPAKKALRQGVIVGLANHTVLIRKDGTERPIDDSASPIRDGQGRVIGCVLVFRDITGRRRTEQQLADDAARIESIVNHVIDGIIAIDENGTVEALNPAAERLFGYRAEEVIGRNVKLLMPEPFHGEHDGYLANYRRTGQAKIIGIGREVEGRRKDGSTFPMELAVSEFWLGKRRYFTGLVRDVTERKKAEEALRRSESALRQSAETLRAKEAELVLVISRTPLLLTRCSRDRRYVFVNRAYAEFLGRPADQIIGRPIAEIMGEAALATITPYVERVLRGESVEFETEVPYAHPGRRFMRALYTPDRDDRGEVIGWVATVSDITDRKQLEHERDERAAELAVAFSKRTEEARRAENAERLLREADRRKDEFLATLAHELRNPLAPLRNALELLRRASDNRTLVEQARATMERQVLQMVRLVDDLLDISRITSGKLQLRKERVELAEVLKTAIETARPLIEASAQELTVTLPPHDVHVEADPTRLAQMFSNLLNNAAKYTEKAGHIWLTAERRDGEAVVSVRDTGIGIAAEHLPHIFTMFSQVAPALERSQGGLGIGLALVKGLVELHDGIIEARSGGTGKGSEFTVHLQIVDVPVEAAHEPSGDGDKGRGGRKCRILVVDDLRDAADSLATMLRLMGHDSRTAYDGLEAVQMAAAFQPNVVLLDIGLPKMSGYEAARRIRDEPWGGNVALVALTGWGQEEDKRRSLEAGFDHHLMKPVEPAALEKLLAAINPVPQQ
jgi:PAS domain S-box-containing protein